MPWTLRTAPIFLGNVLLESHLVLISGVPADPVLNLLRLSVVLHQPVFSQGG